MMTALSAWLGRVVAVVLLVSLVDLLLPNQTMQRYVRLVSGLLVLLTLATPVLSWFRSDFGEKLSANIDSVRLSYGTDQAALEQIEADGRSLSEARNGQAVQLAKTKLSAEIQAAVEGAGLGSVEAVDIQTEPDGSGSEQVVRVELTLMNGSAGGDGADASRAAGESAPIADIEPVAPVDIRIDADADAKADADGEAESGDSFGSGSGVSAGGIPDASDTDASGAQPAAGSGQPANAGLSAQVAALLSNRFGVAPDQVVVRLDSSAPAY